MTLPINVSVTGASRVSVTTLVTTLTALVAEVFAVAAGGVTRSGRGDLVPV